jgi:diguanylate cyclase
MPRRLDHVVSSLAAHLMDATASTATEVSQQVLANLVEQFEALGGRVRPALVPNLSTNISCVAAAWSLIDDHGPPDRTRRSHGAGRRTIPDDSRGISAVNRFVLMV